MNKTVHILGIIMLFSVFFLNTVTAQIRLSFDDEDSIQALRSDIVTGYIDNDQELDSLYYDFQSQAIVILLSSRNYQPISEPYEFYASWTYIEVIEGGFVIRESHMRDYNIFSFIFEEETSKIRHSNIFIERLGNAANDGRGTCSLYLPTGEFSADWDYYDHELDSLFSMPTIHETVLNPPIYLNDTTFFDFNFPTDSLFVHYRKNKMIEMRIEDLSKKEVLDLRSADILSGTEIEQTDIISLFEAYGKSMGYNSNRQFSTTPDEDKDQRYTSQIIPLYKSKSKIIVAISFCWEWYDYDDITHIIYCLDTKTLEGAYSKHNIILPRNDKSKYFFRFGDMLNSRKGAGILPDSIHIIKEDHE